MVSPTTDRLAIATLTLTSILGLNAMYGLAYRNGYMDALLRLRDQGPPYFVPGTADAVRTWYIGFAPLDKALTLATIMFANITDGSAPQLSVYGFHFAGQFLGILVLVGVEALRKGNRRSSLRFYSIWGSAMQLFGYGVVMPLYVIAHLLVSPMCNPSSSPNQQESVRIANLEELEALPLALVVAYILPAILMSTPFLPDQTRQWFGAVWQGVPIWSTVVQKLVAGYLVRKRKSSSSTPPGKDRVDARTRERRLLDGVYRFAFAACVVGQLVPLLIIMTARLFPSLFSPRVVEVMTIRDVFVPPPFWRPGTMKSMADGMQGFFQFDQYVGSLAAAVWAGRLNAKGGRTEDDGMGTGLIDWAKLAALSLVAGPAGVVVWLVWEREDVLVSEVEEFAKSR